MGGIRVVLADDHPLFLNGLELALEAEGLEIVGLASSGAEVLQVVEAIAPDAVLLDLEMPGMNGVACVRALRERHADLKVVMLSGHDDPASIRECLEAGALCFVGKQTAAIDIARALRAVVSPAVYFLHDNKAIGPASAGLLSPAVAPSLTQREREILSNIATGLSNAQVARQLWVTDQTVKFHLSNIYKKLKVTNRTQAARRATELGLVDDVRASRA